MNYPLITTIFIVGSALVGIGVWVGRTNTNISTLKEFMREIRRDMGEIRDRLSSSERALGSGSPLRLTEYGKKLSDALDVSEWAKREADALLPTVRDMESYDVQEYCNTYVFDQYKPDAEAERKIKQCMFDHGATRTHVNEVMSLVLRDELLTRMGKMHLAP